MTHKEIEQIPREIRERLAEHLRLMADLKSQCYRTVETFADELDPPRPESGTVVWIHINNFAWEIALVVTHDSIVDKRGVFRGIDSIEWKPAHVLAPDEVAVKVPPVSEWPEDSDEVDLRYSWYNDPSTYTGVTITRAEAERMEATE